MRIAIIALTLMMTAVTASAETKYATLNEFSAAIVGKTISSKTQKGVPFTATFKQGGTGDFQQKGKKAATFKWTVDGTTVCWDFGDFKECNKVEVVSKTAANFYDSKTGKLNNAYSVK